MSSGAPTLLFLNAGRRIELIRSFRSAFGKLGVGGRIVTTDINGLAPSLYLGDACHLLPRSTDPEFADRLCEVCRLEHVDLVIPLIDPDLHVLVRNREAVEATGARILISDIRVIEICGDKERTASFLARNGFPTPQVFTPGVVKEADFPLFMKPRHGSASIDAFKVDTSEELEFYTHRLKDPIVQEFASGDELTVDVFCDWLGEPLVAVPRRRLKVRAGEVLVGRVERAAELERLCMELVRRLGIVGPSNVQAVLSGKDPLFIEVNPRFGGGCPLTMAAGAPMAEWVVLMALERPIPCEPVVLQDGLTMMRFDDSVFCTSADLLK